jgi:hypothetical protein
MSIFLDNELGLEILMSLPFLLCRKTIDTEPINTKRVGMITLFEFSSTYKSTNVENPEKIKLNK